MLERMILAAALGALFLAATLSGTARAARPDPACSIAPGQAALDQVWSVSAWGLTTGGTVNMIVTFPDGAQSTGPIAVASDGTYTTTGSSNMSATWGFIAPEQKGTYTYQFVGKVKWPQGTFNQLYATCTVSVS